MAKRKMFAEEVQAVTGIDVGASAIRLVTLKRNAEGSPEIVNISTMPIKPWSGRLEENSGEWNRLIEALKKAVESHGAPLGKVVTALPREKAMVRYLDLPATNAAEVEEMLMFDVERHVPFPVEDLELGHTVLDQREDGATVMLAAAPLKEINLVVDLFAAAGLEVDVVDIDIFATCASYLLDKEDETPVRAILDIGRSKANLGVLSGRHVRFSRTSTDGENTLREQLGLVEEKEPVEQLTPEWTNKLIQGLKLQLQAFECQTGGENVTELILCGGLSRHPELSTQLSSGLKRRVRVSTPELDGLQGLNGQMEPELTVAMGLALRNLEEPTINLLPTAVVEKREAEHQKKFIRNIATFALTILILIAGIVTVKFQAQYQVMGNLDAALAEIEPKIADIRRKKAELTEIKRNIDYENSFYKVLTELYRITPENVMFLNISFEKKKQVEIDGRTATADDVYNYVQILKDSPHFKEASLINIQWRQMYKVPVREFHITCVLSSNEERRSRRR